MEVTLADTWEPLAIPNKHCDYINDHTLYFDKSGNLRLLGTCGRNPYIFYKETAFVEFTGTNTLNKMREKRCLFRNNPTRLPKYAPFVFFDKKYHLFFSSIGKIYHFVSDNGVRWKFAGTPINSYLPFLRDPFILEFNRKYYMFLTEFGNKIVVYESENLGDFQFKSAALQLGKGVPRSLFNSSCESPFVLKVGNQFLLFTTIVPSPTGRVENYNKTHVFCSQNPFDFGSFKKCKGNTANLICILDTHAPEILTIKNDHYITTCGWPGYPKPKGISKSENGVFIRKLCINN